jgi:PAS domain S-box-containing protein
MPAPRILIVEDDANLRKTLHDILALKGYTPVSAASGQAALAAAQSQPPAAAVIDLKLADISGLEVLRQLKALSPTIECLMVTGYASQASAIEAVNLGAYSYVQKPYDMEQLLTILRRALERRGAAEALRASEARYRMLIENVGEGIGFVNADERFLFANPAAERLFGASPGGLRAQSLQAFTTPEQFAAITAQTRQRQQGKKSVYEIEICSSDGEKRHLWITAVPQFSETGAFSGTFGVFRDITERKQMDEALRQRLAELEALHTISTALRSAQTRDEALPILLNETLAVVDTEAGIIWLYHPDSGELRIAASRGWFHQMDDAPMKPGEGIAGAVFASGRSYVSAEFQSDLLTHAAAREQVPPGWGGACVPIRAGSETVGVLFVAVQLPRQVTPEQVKLLESLAEMAGAALHRMSLYGETRHQLDQLQALHTIDLAITASTDLRITLSVLLEHVVTQLKVDATNVLLFNPYAQMLTYAAGRGFHTETLKSTSVRLGEGYAGRAGLEQKLVHIPDLRGRKTDFLRSPVFAAEGFVTYYGMPLIAKGQLKGVLEVFHRAPPPPNSTWLSFFETLAGQAAIAIDNAQLLDNLHRSNADLALAYDTTIEGWSRALDLRDRETEGHTLRVTEVTLRLAQAAGVSEAELVHIRRGALLHDIGKMGVPDGVLLKPDSLTDDEWMIMRKHPQFAFDMLAPIAYLKPALDIPVCHHEKWDGTGYPRGLKGEQIPLAARLFAVIDVWDALRSDRPYRAAWPEEQVLEHIRSLAGTHFDPKVVVLFLQVVSEKTEGH